MKADPDAPVSRSVEAGMPEMAAVQSSCKELETKGISSSIVTAETVGVGGSKYKEYSVLPLMKKGQSFL